MIIRRGQGGGGGEQQAVSYIMYGFFKVNPVSGEGVPAQPEDEPADQGAQRLRRGVRPGGGQDNRAKNRAGGAAHGSRWTQKQAQHRGQEVLYAHHGAVPEKVGGPDGNVEEGVDHGGADKVDGV